MIFFILLNAELAGGLTEDELENPQKLEQQLPIPKNPRHRAQPNQANPAQNPQTYQIPGSQGGQISIPRSPTYGVSASGAHYGSPNKDARRSTGQAAAAARRAAESARSKTGKR